MKSLPIHGRGTSYDPPNRFTGLQVEREAWTDPDDAGPETKLYRDTSRTIVVTNDSPDVGFEASVNPYRGCEHGCVWCLDPNTPVLLGDGTTRPLGELRVGDLIYGTIRRGHYRRFVRTRVENVWETWKEAYRITLNDGTELIASSDHRFLTERGWKFVTGSEQGGRRRPHLTVNNKMMGIGGFTSPAPASTDYKRGYVAGIVRGDGFLGSYQRNGGSGRRTYQFRLALVDDAALERTAGYLREFGVEVSRRRFQEATRNGRRLDAIYTGSKMAFERIRNIVAWPRSASSEWRRGFLAGIFDAEGSHSCGVLRMSNTDQTIIDATVTGLRHFGFDFVLEKPPHRSWTLPITVVRVRGGLREHVRLFHTVDTAIRRKRDIVGRAIKCDTDLGIASIEPIGARLLVDITTGTGDFIANGVVSHNCYARPGHEYFGLSPGLDFETKIFVKEKASALLRETLASREWKPKVLAMSGVTDPYQPVERRLEITRGCLEVLAEFRNPVSIITKNHLVTRDIDILSEMARHDAARVTLSVTTLRNEIQRVMEPRTSVPKRRLRAIRELAEAGIPVGVNVAPVVPGLTEHEMAGILEAAAHAGATRAGYILLRLPHGVRELFVEWLEHHFPDRKDKILNRLRSLRGGRLNDPRFGSRMRGEGPYAEQIRQLFDVTCRRLRLNEDERGGSTAAFRRPHGTGGQMELF